MAKVKKKKVTQKTQGQQKTQKKTMKKPPKAELALAAAEEIVSKAEAFDAIVVKRKEVGKLEVRVIRGKMTLKMVKDEYDEAIAELLGMVDQSEMPLFDQAKEEGDSTQKPQEQAKEKGAVAPKEEGAGNKTGQGMAAGGRRKRTPLDLQDENLKVKDPKG